MTDQPATILAAEEVAFGFDDRPAFMECIRWAGGPGECWGIIGPNGAGKSTLLRLLAGLLKPVSGRVTLRGAALKGIPPHERGRQIAFLPQQITRDLQMAAGDVVLMGRYPHRPFGMFENAGDHDIVKRVMTTTQTASFVDRSMTTLSGGEAQRVHVAAALAQEPSVLLLDEPTAALDLYHQLSLFQIIQGLAQTSGLLVVVVTHDVNLAARFCSHILLMDDGKCVASGNPHQVIRPEILETVYNVRLTTAHGVDGERWVMPVSPGMPEGKA